MRSKNEDLMIAIVDYMNEQFFTYQHCCTVLELADHFHITHGAISKYLIEMEKRNMVIREPGKRGFKTMKMQDSLISIPIVGEIACGLYKCSAKQFAKKLINEIAEKTHIPATAGIGSNLYLAKIALDITAKHSKDHIGYLDEETFRATLWHHTPITDFWNIASGISRRLERYYIRDMEGIARCPEDILYKEFGVNAELMIDHAWGRESCTIADIKNYRSKSKSLSNSQILFSDYSFENARIVIQEMALSLCHRLMKEHLIARTVGISVGYSREIIWRISKSIFESFFVKSEKKYGLLRIIKNRSKTV